MSLLYGALVVIAMVVIVTGGVALARRLDLTDVTAEDYRCVECAEPLGYVRQVRPQVSVLRCSRGHAWRCTRRLLCDDLERWAEEDVAAPLPPGPWEAA